MKIRITRLINYEYIKVYLISNVENYSQFSQNGSFTHTHTITLIKIDEIISIMFFQFSYQN